MKFLMNRVFVTALILFSVIAEAQQTRVTAEDSRIERLIGLAKVWGAVKYFHPFLAYREIDWDKALIETIPKVNSTKTPQEYLIAINQMLATLGDDSTRAELDTETKAAPAKQSIAPAKESLRTEDGIVIIDAIRAADTGAKNRIALNESVVKINEAIATAKAIIIDSRSEDQTEGRTAYIFDTLLRRILPQMLDSNVTLGSVRYRIHNGYATQTDFGASFYYSAFVSDAPATMNGHNKAKSPPIVFIINKNTPDETEVWSGLQFGNRAFVIQEGEQAPQTSGNFKMELADGVKVQIRTYESLNPDGSTGFRADAVVQKTGSQDAAMLEAIRAVQQNEIGQSRQQNGTTLTPQVSQKDKAYAEMEFPNTEYRLLALFRFWNIINYFYPYKALIGDLWQTVLPRYIPKFEANKDAADYQLTVLEMVTEIHDSHGGVPNANAFNQKFGMFLPPIVLRYIQSQTVITSVLDEKLSIKIGDVILNIDGEPIEKRREYLSRFVAASTPQALMSALHWTLLSGQKDTVVKLRVRDINGEVREVELVRSMSRNDPKLFEVLKRSTPIVEVLPSGYGYVDLARLQVGDVDKMFETIKNTPAIIFDMRGYPNGTAWSIAPRLTEKQMPVAALFSRPFLEAPSMGDSELDESPNYTFAQRIPEREGDPYKGKVVMLINENSISQAEHTCLFFEAATDVTFIGTPTVGANGDVTFMILPGNLAVSFTGHNVRHADGRQLQRVGIQPTIEVAPTLRGLISGRDEILEAAIQYLQQNIKK